MRPIRVVAAGVTGALAFTLAGVPVSAVAAPGSQDLRKGVRVSGIMHHERVFQRIADRHDDTRASGTTGYRASVRYVARRLKKAGYTVRLQPFTFAVFTELAPSVVDQVAPTTRTIPSATMEYSGAGDVTGTVVPIDVTLPPPTQPGSTSGCEAADFAPAGAQPAIALIQRGTCTFEIKAMNAKMAGYDAVAIFNEGQEGRRELLTGVTLTNPVGIPVVGLSFADGKALAETSGAQLRIRTQTSIRVSRTWNVLADSPTGNRKAKVVVGAHLDSVAEGPGINDNGSGSATILEIAEEMAELRVKPRQQVRFAFWGAEENGLLGSTYYVSRLSPKALRRHVANLNFDMVGSPNYVRFVYDGNGSTGASEAGPRGSGLIERVFRRYFRSQGLASAQTPFDGRSDYGPFIAAGIPAGGLFTGAEGIKTPNQQRRFGGEAGVAYDPCYHQACDDLTNLSRAALREMSDAAAHAVWKLARTRRPLFAGPRQTMRAASPMEVGHAGSHPAR